MAGFLCRRGADTSLAIKAVARALASVMTSSVPPLLDLFIRRPVKARAAAAGGTVLRLASPAGEAHVDLARAAWIGFVQVGEAHGAVHEGWWLLPAGEGALGVETRCPCADLLLRDEALAAVAERAPSKFVIDLASRPWCFRGRRNFYGFAPVSVHEVERLRRGRTQIVTSVREFPIVL